MAQDSLHKNKSGAIPRGVAAERAPARWCKHGVCLRRGVGGSRAVARAGRISGSFRSPLRRTSRGPQRKHRRGNGAGCIAFRRGLKGLRIAGTWPILPPVQVAYWARIIAQRAELSL